MFETGIIQGRFIGEAEIAANKRIGDWVRDERKALIRLLAALAKTCRTPWAIVSEHPEE